MKKFNRSLRREHKERMKKKAHRIMPYYDDAFKLADNLAHCSCMACCNPRHSGYWGHSQTISERMADRRLKEEMKDYYTEE